MKIFEWNFQQTFLIRFHEKLIQNGWAWPLFDTYHTHFSKTLLFLQWSLKPNKSWKFKNFFCIFGNHFIGLFNGILHVLIFWVVAEKQKNFDWGLILIWNRLYTIVWNLLVIQIPKPINYTPKPVTYTKSLFKTHNIYNWNP